MRVPADNVVELGVRRWSEAEVVWRAAATRALGLAADGEPLVAARAGVRLFPHQLATLERALADEFEHDTRSEASESAQFADLVDDAVPVVRASSPERIAGLIEVAAEDTATWDRIIDLGVDHAYQAVARLAGESGLTLPGAQLRLLVRVNS